jgi:Zn-dependent protease/predicted transcriptional regulator
MTITNGSLRIARIFQIPVRVHWSFGLLFLLIVYMGWLSDIPNSIWVSFLTYQFLFLISMFSCVVLHEFGHALMARVYGVSTRDITILPIGGIARLERIPEKPIEEFWVAFAGPAVNVVIYFILVGVMWLGYGFSANLYDTFSGTTDVFTERFSSIEFLYSLARSNLYLVAFNLLPAFPMDGGRVLRALLSMHTNRANATKIAAILGQLFAIVFFVVGIYYAFYILSLISIFIFSAARSEYKSVWIDSVLETHRVADVMRKNFTILTDGDPMQIAVNELSKGVEGNFLVVDMHGVLKGTIQEDDIVNAMKRNEHTQTIARYTDYNYQIVTPEQTLRRIYQIMLTHQQFILPVLQSNEKTLVGVVDWQTVQQILDIQEQV